MENFVHIGTVRDGSVVKLKGSQHICMKVCDKNGRGGVVSLGGLYTSTQDLLSVDGVVIAENLDEFYHKEEEEDEITDACLRESLGNNWW